MSGFLEFCAEKSGRVGVKNTKWRDAKPALPRHLLRLKVRDRAGRLLYISNPVDNAKASRGFLIFEKHVVTFW